MRANTRLAALILVASAAACAPGDDEVPGDAPADADVEAGMPTDEVPTEVDEAALQRWDVQLDDEDAPGDFQMVEEDAGWRVTTGPAGITWRPSDLVEGGDFTARATFREMGSEPGHREAYGLLVGGFHLESPDQRYAYFIVRGTGDYMVRTRDGEETSTLVDWTPSDAVNAIGSDAAEPENTLEVRVRGDSVSFAVNDQVVETLPTEEVDPHGLVGLRVNHRLDVRVSDFEIEREGGAEG